MVSHQLSIPAWIIVMKHASDMWTLVSEAGISAGITNKIPQYSVGCNYLSLPEIPAAGTKVPIYEASHSSQMGHSGGQYWNNDAVVIAYGFGLTHKKIVG